MNYLGHLLSAHYLKHSFPGQFLGDYIKGVPERFSTLYPPQIVQGVLLHRKLDSFTDSHHSLVAIKHLAPKNLKRFCGIIMDMTLDHHIAVNWNDSARIFFPNQSFPSFSQFCNHAYMKLQEGEKYFPPSATKRFHQIREKNWLYQYQNFSTLENSFTGIALRITRGQPLLEAGLFVRENWNYIEEKMEQFLEDLIIYLNSFYSGKIK